MTDPLDEPTRLIDAIGTALVHDPAYAALDWDAIALVAEIGPGGSSSSLHGYAYLADGRIVAEIPDEFAIQDQFDALRDAMARVGDRPWQAALVQITRSTGRVRFQFELDDAQRWSVTPTNWQAMQEALRPTGER